MLRFAVIASGSDGNAAVVQAGGQVVLLDCGVSFRRLQAGLARLGLGPGDLSAALLTHEHGDHVCGLPTLLARRRLPLLAGRGTLARLRRLEALSALGTLDWVPLRAGVPVWEGGLEILPLATSHDAGEPLGYRLEAPGTGTIAYATDTGVATGDLGYGLRDCDLVAIESNHCPEMLRTGPYPRRLKQRIHSDRGHLSNHEAARLVGTVAGPRLAHVVGLHLSRTNNLPELAHGGLVEAVRRTGGPAQVHTADRNGTGWLTVA